MPVTVEEEDVAYVYVFNLRIRTEPGAKYQQFSQVVAKERGKVACIQGADRLIPGSRELVRAILLARGFEYVEWSRHNDDGTISLKRFKL